MGHKIISVTYGHGTPGADGKLSASGKLYDYETTKNYRTGDVIVVPVQHYKSKKLYNTLAVVRMTTEEDTVRWKQKADHLTDPNNDIHPRNVAQRLEIARAQGLNVDSDRDVNITTLPGYKDRGTDRKWSASKPKIITKNGEGNQ